jgi:hypothetical protein
MITAKLNLSIGIRIDAHYNSIASHVYTCPIHATCVFYEFIISWYEFYPGFRLTISY